MVKTKSWVKAKELTGNLTREHFQLVEEELPELKDGDVLFEAIFLGVDPYMRAQPVAIGKPMIGEQIARIIESKNPDYKVGTEWLCFFPWQTRTVFNPNKQFDNIPDIPGLPTKIDVRKCGMPSAFTKQPTVVKMPDLGNLPHSLALGTVGMPGATAYIGLLDHCSPQPGEAVLVNGAAGGVGNVAGQIAKIMGCKVIGYAGTDDKVRWLKEELGFDFAFNYKKVDLSESIKQAAPDGVDVYYDSVGGEFSDTVITQHMKMCGRVVIMGSSSYYSAKSTQGPHLYLTILMKRLSIHGFYVPQAPRTRWLEAFSDMVTWIKEGKLKYREHVTVGFENLPDAFVGLFNAEHTGKAILKV